MNTLILALLTSLTASAAPYDGSWHKADYFTGEYPNGFAVIAENATVPGHTKIDADGAASVSCALPLKANFHPWNPARAQNSDYVTMSKIVTLTVKENFTFKDDDGAKIRLKKGDKIEYLVYGAEGWFTVRINGKEYNADQSLFEKVEEVPEGSFVQDEWMRIDCVGGEKTWVRMSELSKLDAAGDTIYLPGLANWFLGFVEYGVSRDLTDEDLTKKP